MFNVLVGQYYLSCPNFKKIILSNIPYNFDDHKEAELWARVLNGKVLNG